MPHDVKENLDEVVDRKEHADQAGDAEENAEQADDEKKNPLQLDDEKEHAGHADDVKENLDEVDDRKEHADQADDVKENLDEVDDKKKEHAGHADDVKENLDEVDDRKEHADQADDVKENLDEVDDKKKEHAGHADDVKENLDEVDDRKEHADQADDVKENLDDDVKEKLDEVDYRKEHADQADDAEENAEQADDKKNPDQIDDEKEHAGQIDDMKENLDEVDDKKKEHAGQADDVKENLDEVDYRKEHADQADDVKEKLAEVDDRKEHADQAKQADDEKKNPDQIDDGKEHAGQADDEIDDRREPNGQGQAGDGKENTDQVDDGKDHAGQGEVGDDKKNAEQEDDRKEKPDQTDDRRELSDQGQAGVNNEDAEQADDGKNPDQVDDWKDENEKTKPAADRIPARDGKENAKLVDDDQGQAGDAEENAEQADVAKKNPDQIDDEKEHAGQIDDVKKENVEKNDDQVDDECEEEDEASTEQPSPFGEAERRLLQEAVTSQILDEQRQASEPEASAAPSPTANDVSWEDPPQPQVAGVGTPDSSSPSLREPDQLSPGSEEQEPAGHTVAQQSDPAIAFGSPGSKPVDTVLEEQLREIKAKEAVKSARSREAKLKRKQRERELLDQIETMLENERSMRHRCTEEAKQERVVITKTTLNTHKEQRTRVTQEHALKAETDTKRFQQEVARRKQELTEKHTHVKNDRLAQLEDEKEAANTERDGIKQRIDECNKAQRKRKEKVDAAVVQFYTERKARLEQEKEAEVERARQHADTVAEWVHQRTSKQQSLRHEADARVRKRQQEIDKRVEQQTAERTAVREVENRRFDEKRVEALRQHGEKKVAASCQTVEAKQQQLQELAEARRREREAREQEAFEKEVEKDAEMRRRRKEVLEAGRKRRAVELSDFERDVAAHREALEKAAAVKREEEVAFWKAVLVKQAEMKAAGERRRQQQAMAMVFRERLIKERVDEIREETFWKKHEQSEWIEYRKLLEDTCKRRVENRKEAELQKVNEQRELTQLRLEERRDREAMFHEILKARQEKVKAGAELRAQERGLRKIELKQEVEHRRKQNAAQVKADSELCRRVWIEERTERRVMSEAGIRQQFEYETEKRDKAFIETARLPVTSPGSKSRKDAAAALQQPKDSDKPEPMSSADGDAQLPDRETATSSRIPPAWRKRVPVASSYFDDPQATVESVMEQQGALKQFILRTPVGHPDCGGGGVEPNRSVNGVDNALASWVRHIRCTTTASRDPELIRAREEISLLCAAMAAQCLPSPADTGMSRKERNRRCLKALDALHHVSKLTTGRQHILHTCSAQAPRGTIKGPFKKAASLYTTTSSGNVSESDDDEDNTAEQESCKPITLRSTLQWTLTWRPAVDEKSRCSIVIALHAPGNAVARLACGARLLPVVMPGETRRESTDAHAKGSNKQPLAGLRAHGAAVVEAACLLSVVMPPLRFLTKQLAEARATTGEPDGAPEAAEIRTTLAAPSISIVGVGFAGVVAQVLAVRLREDAMRSGLRISGIDCSVFGSCSAFSAGGIPPWIDTASEPSPAEDAKDEPREIPLRLASTAAALDVFYELVDNDWRSHRRLRVARKAWPELRTAIAVALFDAPDGDVKQSEAEGGGGDKESGKQRARLFRCEKLPNTVRIGDAAAGEVRLNPAVVGENAQRQKRCHHYLHTLLVRASLLDPSVAPAQLFWPVTFPGDPADEPQPHPLQGTVVTEAGGLTRPARRVFRDIFARFANAAGVLDFEGLQTIHLLADGLRPDYVLERRFSKYSTRRDSKDNKADAPSGEENDGEENGARMGECDEAAVSVSFEDFLVYCEELAWEDPLTIDQMLGGLGYRVSYEIPGANDIDADSLACTPAVDKASPSVETNEPIQHLQLVRDEGNERALYSRSTVHEPDVSWSCVPLLEEGNQNSLTVYGRAAADAIFACISRKRLGAPSAQPLTARACFASLWELSEYDGCSSTPDQQLWREFFSHRAFCRDCVALRGAGRAPAASRDREAGAASAAYLGKDEFFDFFRWLCTRVGETAMWRRLAVMGFSDFMRLEGGGALRDVHEAIKGQTICGCWSDPTLGEGYSAEAERVNDGAESAWSTMSSGKPGKKLGSVARARNRMLLSARKSPKGKNFTTGPYARPVVNMALEERERAKELAKTLAPDRCRETPVVPVTNLAMSLPHNAAEIAAQWTTNPVILGHAQKITELQRELDNASQSGTAASKSSTKRVHKTSEHLCHPSIHRELEVDQAIDACRPKTIHDTQKKVFGCPIKFYNPDKQPKRPPDNEHVPPRPFPPPEMSRAEQAAADRLVEKHYRLAIASGNAAAATLAKKYAFKPNKEPKKVSEEEMQDIVVRSYEQAVQSKDRAKRLLLKRIRDEDQAGKKIMSKDEVNELNERLSKAAVEANLEAVTKAAAKATLKKAEPMKLPKDELETVSRRMLEGGKNANYSLPRFYRK
ncbi:hypothetical protein DIPPA_17541 [Diplonema papillatum]|nr:hypothetical protein DIPPA_17541 [Diplonema papillatum]